MDKREIDIWHNRIGRAEQLQSEKREERLQAIKLYTGTFFGIPTKTSELSEVNFVYEFMKILVSSIYSRDPYIFVRSRSAKWQAFSETMETVINVYWQRLQMKRKIKQAVEDAALQPPGFIEIGYTLFTEKDKIIRDLETSFPDLKSVGKPQKTEEEQGILDETIKDDDVFANYVSSWNILWPDGYHTIRECPYMIKKQVIPLIDLLANPMYKSIKHKLIGARSSAMSVQPVSQYKMSDSPKLTGHNYSYDDETIPITLFHIWDKRTQQRFTLARNFNLDTLFEKNWDWYIDGFPYYPLIFNNIPQTDEKANSYPMSDIVPMLPQLKELSLISSAMNKHRKRAGTLIIAKEGIIDETKATNIQNSSDIDLVFLPDLSDASMRGFTPPALPTDFYRLRDVILQDLMRISGFQQLLYSAKGIETATESTNVRVGAELRQSEKQDIIEDFTVEIARGLAGLIWQFKQNKREIAEMVGEEVNEEMWPTLPDDPNEASRLIQRELFFKIDAGSTRPPQDEAVERKQWENLATVIKASFPNRVKDDVFLKQWLKKYDFHDIDSMVISYDEQEVMAAQEENKYLMQGMPQVVTPNENDLLHLQVHGQVYQTPGLQATQQMDEHVDKHAKNMEMKNPKVNPQRGDTKAPAMSTAPEINRQGVPTYSDMLGATKNMSGMGGEKGGRK